EHWKVKSNGSVIADDIKDGFLYGPYADLPAGDYQVAFKLSAPDSVVSEDVAWIDVIAQCDGERVDLVPETIVSAKSLRDNNGVADQKFGFSLHQAHTHVEFRLKPLVLGLGVEWVRLATPDEAIWQHYYQIGGIDSVLGPPRSGLRTAAKSTYGTTGLLRRFEGGTIYWNSVMYRSYPVHGVIEQAYEGQHGTGSTMLGFPMSVVKNCVSSTGLKGGVQLFEHGFAIYSYIDSNTANEVAYSVTGGICEKYMKEGGASSALGFPTSDEYQWNEYRRSDFERGVILWSEMIDPHYIVLLNPIPHVEISAPNEIEIGSDARIILTATNLGGQAKEGYFSVSFPDQPKIISFQALGPEIEITPHQDMPWPGSYGDGRKHILRYPLVEGSVFPFKAGKKYAFEVTIRPLEIGIHKIEYKFSLKQHKSLGWIADPPIGSSSHRVGQQLENVYEHPIRVVEHFEERNEPSKGGIFISYRHSDSDHIVPEIYKRLATRYGENNIFWDREDIPLGRSFRREIDLYLHTCVVQLVVIGKGWLDPRLFEPGDVLSAEIATGIARKILVIPILVDDARMPIVDQLPMSIKALEALNAVRWDADYDRLIALLDKLI
ncbi:MAG: TIR domain-containing protein, partial [Anaerolineae bacterium]|nr:TIR domain-containing protein [Anaerolineae bacterium]